MKIHLLTLVVLCKMKKNNNSNKIKDACYHRDQITRTFTLKMHYICSR